MATRQGRKDSRSKSAIQRSSVSFASFDWLTILIYIMLMGLGWVSVCGASYDPETTTNFLDLGSRSGMQLVWIGTSLLLGAIILMTDDRLIESLSYIIYLGFLILLFATPFLAHDIKGSLSWIKIGSFSIQPAEFAKFATALCIAKVISAFELNLSRMRDLIVSALVVVTPMALIVLQKETGSALVYTAFFLMFYREGMSGSYLSAAVAAVVFFVIGVRGDIVEMLVVVGLVAIIAFFVTHGKKWLLRSSVIALAVLGSLGVMRSSNYVMNNVLQPHQQSRIQVLLGLKDDPRGAGYNVIQAKIAIGSGGLEGKGFLNGTQTKLKYVPEQDTDFIFCTVGEEEGFIGCAIVLGLFLILILRLIYLSERQPYTFGRVYGYCVMSVFLFHVFINVGMVLGLTPVIGIPLPFFSYGGSSLWGFTILLLVFLRIDAGRNRMKR